MKAFIMFLIGFSIGTGLYFISSKIDTTTKEEVKKLTEQTLPELVIDAEAAEKTPEESEPEEEVTGPRSLGIFKITAYCSCSKCCGKSDGITASGTHATAGRTIAAPKRFAFGTKLIINGHTYTVEDRGGAIKGNKIDIYFDSHQEALNFGVQYIEVFAEE